MSGGMDIDWRGRERAVADDLYAKIRLLDEEIVAKEKERRRLDGEYGDLMLLLYAHASEIEDARKDEDI